MASSTALTKRSSDTALMPPPPQPKRIRRPAKVLDEDTYTSALDHIIARDFFPGLLETETQQDYLDALEAGNKEWIHDAEQKVRVAMTPGPRGRRGVSMTPLRLDRNGSATPRDWRGQTPRSTRGSATPSRHDTASTTQEQESDPKVDVNMGLSAFQARYTSEDNESFNKILDKQNAKRAAQYGWLWNGNKLPSKQMIAQAAHRQKLIASSEPAALLGPTTVVDATAQVSQALTIAPKLSQILDDRGSIMATRAPSDPRNGFMFTPEPLTDAHPEHQTRAEAAAAASLAPPKSVAFTNTRFPTTILASDNDDSIPPSPSLSAIDAAIAGRPRHRADSTVYANSAVPGGETPRVNGYAFVDAEATPSELGISEDSDDTSTQPSTLLQQLIADSNTSSTNSFTISEPKARESLHHRLVEKSLASKRKPHASSSASSLREGTLTPVGATPSLHSHVLARLGDGRRTPTPKFASSPRVGRDGGGEGVGRGGARGVEAGGLTPAARMLYHKLGKTPLRASGGDAFAARGGDERSKKGAWTPTPLRVKKAA